MVSRIVCSPPVEAGGSATLQCEHLVVPGAGDLVFFGGGPFCPRLRDENGFLLVTPPGPAGRGVVGDLGTGFDGVGIGALCPDRALCQTNSQSSGRITSSSAAGRRSVPQRPAPCQGKRNLGTQQPALARGAVERCRKVGPLGLGLHGSSQGVSVSADFSHEATKAAFIDPACGHFAWPHTSQA